MSLQSSKICPPNSNIDNCATVGPGKMLFWKWPRTRIMLHTANDPLSAGSSKHDFDTAVRVYMMIEAYHEVIMSQLLIIRV